MNQLALSTKMISKFVLEADTILIKKFVHAIYHSVGDICIYDIFEMFFKYE